MASSQDIGDLVVCLMTIKVSIAAELTYLSMSINNNWTEASYRLRIYRFHSDRSIL